MGQIVSVHSYRGGTGKSNLTANLAWLAAKDGAKVAVLDTDLQSPGTHVVFGLDQGRITHTLTDFLFGKCDLEEAAYDCTTDLGLEGGSGSLHLLPSSMQLEMIMQVLEQGYDVGKLNLHFETLVDSLDLDLLLVDTHPGLNRETLLNIAVADTLVVLIRPDSQDFHGTAVLLEVAGKLRVPRTYMVANKVVPSLDPHDVRARIEEAFKQEVIGTLPLSEEMAILGSNGLFVRKHPRHALTEQLHAVHLRLREDRERDRG